jgi:hypothetical protein
MFLRDYLDAIFYQQKPDRRKRTRVYDTSNFATGETKAPLNAPRWAKSGYNGSMKAVIKRAVSKYNNNSKDSAEEYEENQKDDAKRNDNNDNKKDK